MRLGLFVLALSIAMMTTAQEAPPWKRQPCVEHAGWCGILVTFNPPIKDALLVPNEVTVEVPLELGQVSEVVVNSYPRGTGVAHIPSEDFVVIYHSQKVGKYARFQAMIKKCTDQGSVEVNVFLKGFESTPVNAGVGGAVECRQVKDSKSAH